MRGSARYVDWRTQLAVWLLVVAVLAGAWLAGLMGVVAAAALVSPIGSKLVALDRRSWDAVE